MSEGKEKVKGKESLEPTDYLNISFVYLSKTYAELAKQLNNSSGMTEANQVVDLMKKIKELL